MNLARFALVLILPATALAQPKGEVPADVLDAWKKAGAIVVGVQPGDGNFVPSVVMGSDTTTPVFYFPKPKDVKFESLPDPKVPFGLSIESTADVSLKKLARFKTLEVLWAKYCKWPDAKAKELAGLKQLKMLRADVGLDDHRDVLLKSVGELTELTSLEMSVAESFSNPQTTSVEPLGKLKKLEHLSLLFKQVKPESAKAWAALTNLKTFELTGKCTDDDAKHLAGLEKLTTLKLTMGGEITDRAVKHFSKMTGLKVLLLSYNKVGDAAAADIAKFTELENLQLGNNPITDAAVKELAGLEKLRLLDLSNTNLTDKSLPVIEGMKSLKQVRLFNITFSPEAVKKLKAARPDLTVYVTEKK